MNSLADVWMSLPDGRVADEKSANEVHGSRSGRILVPSDMDFDLSDFRKGLSQ